ncbi:OmpP1/FadL family transporter [Zavarzinia aquatilis]|uniref:Long-chain fatty acid transporter n=1 Tax=Zavarzinia aquatilis TaxID=2211142 RepID=A0A317E7Z2_9PROT|nr:outer membrane protein transport protein [Zavarzinia aquatilis]PWR21453.1 long-chain fatty acid transporter [Zavarzinia aquatilis]
MFRPSPLTRRIAASGFAAAAIGAATPASATVGYFDHGIGIQAKGAGGAAIAYPKDSVAIGANPASAFSLGNRADIGIELFRPDRNAAFSGNFAGPDESFDGNDTENFLIPEAGYVRRLSDTLAAGIALYGNGGMNTDYGRNPFGRFGATGSAGVNLEQAILAPSIAWQPVPGHSVGVSLNIAYQRFEAKGIGLFAGYSQDPAHVSDQGTDHSFGAGVKIGYLGEITPWLTIGAVYQSKTWMQEFDKYAGLFADQGDFDLPANYGIGFTLKAPYGLDVTGEVQRIEYSDVGAVGNPVNSLFAGVPLGADNGPGFGWDDVTVFRLGANYRLNPNWQVRGGWAYVTQPIPEDQTFFNILAPGVVRHHFTLGATWNSDGGLEISAFGFYAPKVTLEGENSIPPAFAGGNADVDLSEVAVGVAVGWTFGAGQ